MSLSYQLFLSPLVVCVMAFHEQQINLDISIAYILYEEIVIVKNWASFWDSIIPQF